MTNSDDSEQVARTALRALGCIAIIVFVTGLLIGFLAGWMIR